MRIYGLFLESIKPVTNTHYFNEEINENIFYVYVFCCFIIQISSFFIVVYKWIHSKSTNSILRKTYLKKNLIFASTNRHRKYLLDLIESGKMRYKWNFKTGCIEQNHLVYIWTGQIEFLKWNMRAGADLYLISDRIGSDAKNMFLLITVWKLWFYVL